MNPKDGTAHLGMPAAAHPRPGSSSRLTPTVFGPGRKPYASDHDESQRRLPLMAYHKRTKSSTPEPARRGSTVLSRGGRVVTAHRSHTEGTWITRAANRAGSQGEVGDGRQVAAQLLVLEWPEGGLE